MAQNQIKSWPKKESLRGPDLMIFKARYDWYINPRTDKKMKRVVLESPDWVNVLALTSDNHVLLVKQFRFGTAHITTEIPAGLVDPGEEPLETARRELLEETGYTSSKWSYLGFVEPNPAFLNNRCHHWLAEEITKTAEPDLDAGEDIELRFMNFDEIRQAVRDGRIDHVLALSAFSRYPQLWNGIYPHRKDIGT
jgi:8-oxo-dGTP pyrophosphatase MutT (NUDIX family)